MKRNKIIYLLGLLITFGSFTTSCSKDDNGLDIPSVENANIETTFSLNEMYNSETERIRLWRRQKIADFVATGVYVQPEGSVKINTFAFFRARRD